MWRVFLVLGAIVLIIFFEWGKARRIRNMDWKKAMVILTILFFLGSALAALFS